MWIVVEGIDCSGKTTTINRFKELFEERGHKVIVTQGIGTTELGSKLRELIPYLNNVSHHVRTFFYLTSIQITYDYIQSLIKEQESLKNNDKELIIITDRYINTLLCLNIIYPDENNYYFKQCLCNLIEELTDSNLNHLNQEGSLSYYPNVLITLTQPEEIILERLNKKQNVDHLDKEFIDNRVTIQRLYKLLSDGWNGASHNYHGINSIEEVDEMFKELFVNQI